MSATLNPDAVKPSTAPPPRDPGPLVRAPRRRVAGFEVAVVRIAVAVIVAYVLDDAFIHPEPGTTARDHLASGLIPALILILLAIAYPRMRAWWQAMLAGSVGALALVAGIGVSTRDVVIVGGGGDDMTGMLAGMAGGVLIVCGAVAAARAWRPRSEDRSLGWRYARRALLAVAVLFAAVFVVVPIGMSILATHTVRSPITPVDLGRPYQHVSFRTNDGLRLVGWYVPSLNRAAVIAFPGRTGPVGQARMLARHGYGVLMFDPRGAGESQGDYNAYGWKGERDLDAAIRFLAIREDVDLTRIGGIGLSVGGELMLQTAAHQPLLRAVVADGAGVRSIRDHLAVDGRGPISWISPLLVQTAATAVLSDSLPPPALSRVVSRISPRATFFIYAGHGGGGEDQTPAYYAAASQPKQLWEIPEAGHTGGLAARPGEYQRRVTAFFDRYLLR